MTCPATATPPVTLSELRAVVVSWCDRADPELLSGADAAAEAEQVAALIRRLQVKQVALAARAKEASGFSARFPTAAAWQAHINGCSQSEARRDLDTAERLAGCPAVAAALAAGDLSIDEAHLVTSAAIMNPAAERRLVEQARKHNFADTRAAADRARNAVFSREQEQARLARIHKLRRVRESTDGDQLAWVDSHLVLEAWAAVKPVLDAFTDAQYQAARRAGTRDSHDAYRADALIAALRAAGDSIGIASSPVPPVPPPQTPPPRTPTSRRPDAQRPPALVGPADPGGPVEPVETSTGTDPLDPLDTSAIRPDRVSSDPVVLVDGIALRRGWATDRETCHLAPTDTPVSVGWIEAVLPTAAVDVLVHDRNDIRAHAVVHRRRPRPGPGSGDDGRVPTEPRPTVVVLIDAVALQHPPPDHDGTDSIAVPRTDLRIPVAWLRRVVPDEIADAVAERLVDMTRYVSTTRHTPRPVRLAVLARDRRCNVPGCARRLRLERDHLHEFGQGGATTNVNIRGLCDEHHGEKTRLGARIETTATERLWYPPPATGPDAAAQPAPWRAPLGEHLTGWDLDHLPDSAGRPHEAPRAAVDRSDERLF